jgi:folate-binding protein YgfZ
MFNVAHTLNKLAQGEKAIFVKKQGILRLAGTEARAFLQRMSTNDLSRLHKDHPLQTSFITNKGRMVDHCLVFETQPHTITLASSHENGTILQSWLEQFHFIEDFELNDISEKSRVTYILTSGSTPLLAHAELPLTRCWQAALNPDLSLSFFAAIDATIQERTFIIEEDIWQSLRIASLMPISPNEINNRWMPHNINLGEFIADNKGCYIGQEVIAKARTFQKNIKTLQGTMLSPSDLASLKIGSMVNSIDGHRGEVTSIAPLYLAQEANALVMVGSHEPLAGNEYDWIASPRPFIAKK